MISPTFLLYLHLPYLEVDGKFCLFLLLILKTIIMYLVEIIVSFFILEKEKKVV